MKMTLVSGVLAVLTVLAFAAPWAPPLATGRDGETAEQAARRTLAERRKTAARPWEASAAYVAATGADGAASTSEQR